MTRTRQSTAHGRRGAFRREVVTALQKKVGKPRNLGSVGQKPSPKGRYTCGQCRKFDGPRKSVEDHCRGKHKLAGNNLQKAVLMIGEVVKDEKPGSSREETTPSRTFKRQRGTVADGAANKVDVTNVKRKRETSPVKEKNSEGHSKVEKGDANIAYPGTDGRDLQVVSGETEKIKASDRVISSDGNSEEEGEKSPRKPMEGGVNTDNAGSEVSVEGIDTVKPAQVTSATPAGVDDLNSLNNGGIITGESQSFTGKLLPVSSSLKPQPVVGSMCEKCKRTFSRARQLTKHKCFAAVKDEPEQPTKPKPVPPEKRHKKVEATSVQGSCEYFMDKTTGPQANKEKKSSKEDKGGPKVKVQDKASPVTGLMKAKTTGSQVIPACKATTATTKLEKAPAGTPIQYNAVAKTLLSLAPTMGSSATAELHPVEKEKTIVANATTSVMPNTVLNPGKAFNKLGITGSPEAEKKKSKSSKEDTPVLPNAVLKPGKVFKKVEITSVQGSPEADKKTSNSSKEDTPVMPNTLKLGTPISADTSLDTPVIMSPPGSHPSDNIATSPSPGATQKTPPAVTVETEEGDIPLEDILQSLEEEFVQETETADESEAFKKGMTETVDGSKSRGDPNTTPTGPDESKAGALEATGLESPSKSDVSMATAGKSATTKLKTETIQSPNKPANIVVKKEQLASNKEKIAESIRLRTEPVAIPVKTPEKVQIAIQNGSPFCVCSFCGKVTVCAELMKEHLSSHVQDYFPFQCASCDFVSRKRGRITAHMKTEHGGFLQCEKCNYTTYDQDKLDRHYKYWNRDFSDSCRFCHKRIPVGTKEEHMKTAHSKSAEELASINMTADAFTCRTCGERLKSRHARRDHEKRHNPHHTCPLCPYTTNSQDVFINHGRKHRVILVCCECLAKFHSSHALKEHVKEHVNSQGRVGEVDHLYEKSIDQSVFVASVLDESSIPECDIIGLDMGMRVREEERRVSQHHSGETGQRPIAPPVTVDEMRSLNFGEEYDSFVENIAYRHLSMATLSFMFARYGRRECPYCGFLLHSLGSWQIHVASHEGKAHLHCEECDYKCRHKFLLKRHIQITHKKQDFPCDICGKRFPYREYVYLHKRKDHDNGLMKCTFCTEVPFQTEDEKVMKRHIIEEHPEMSSKQIAEIVGRTVHFTGRDGFLFVNCKYCQKGFNRVAFLRQHVQLAHMNKKEFVCDQCGYKSHTKSRLNTHMAVHTEVRNITCDQCGAGFKNKVYLYKHIRRSHKRYATERGAAYCKRTRLKNVISLLQKERQEGSSYERQEIIQKEKARLFGIDNKGLGSVEGVGIGEAPSEPGVGGEASSQPPSRPTQINVFQCGDCGEYFDSIQTLKRHFTVVHGESPTIPLDFDPAVTGGGGAVATTSNNSEQVSMALNALSDTSTPVSQLFQCAKCNRMFPDMKSVEHHVKDVHATDTFLISEEGDIPSQELDLAAEVINHLTREAGQSGAISMMQSVISQSTLDALSLEAQNAATALTTLPDAVLEMSNQAALKSENIEPTSFNTPQQEMGAGCSQQEVTNVAASWQETTGVNASQQEMTGADAVLVGEKVRVVSERGEDLEAAHLLQSMGVFQQLAANSTSDGTSGSSPSAADSPLMIDFSGTNKQVIQHGEGEDSVTIMLIEDDQKTQNTE